MRLSKFIAIFDLMGFRRCARLVGNYVNHMNLTICRTNCVSKIFQNRCQLISIKVICFTTTESKRFKDLINAKNFIETKIVVGEKYTHKILYDVFHAVDGDVTVLLVS